MIWWVLGAVLLLLILFFRMRIRLHLVFRDAEVRVSMCFGPIYKDLTSEKAEEPSEEPEPQKEQKPAKKKRGFRPGKEDWKDAWRTLWPALRRALGRTRKSVRIDPLRLSLTLGGREDPADVSQKYGAVQTLVWTGMPMLEEVLDLPDPHIHIGVDFNEEAIHAEGEAGVSIRLGTAVSIAFGVAVPAIRWLLRVRKRQARRREAKRTDPASAAGTAA